MTVLGDGEKGREREGGREREEEVCAAQRLSHMEIYEYAVIAGMDQESG